jgi:hypothetical protein
MLKQQQDRHEPLSGEHAANDQGPVDWEAHHKNGKTLTLKSKRKDHERSN